MQKFLGSKVLVTGGTAGIGKAIVVAFAKEGADVCFCGTSPERLTTVLQELTTQWPSQKFCAAKVDVANSEEVLAWIDGLSAPWNAGIDILVNNAGIVIDGLLLKMDEAAWDKVLDTNLKSCFLFSKKCLRSMLRSRYGRIINISSIVGIIGQAGQCNYAASKAGMIGFTKALAKEVAAKGVTVNCIAPGFIATAMTDQLPAPLREEMLSRIPMHDFGVPDDIAHAVLFFASRDARYVTGQVLTVDGGGL